MKLSANQSLRILYSSPEVFEVESSWDPLGSRPPKHYHPAQDEHFEVRSGRLRVCIEGEERELRPGDTVDIPQGAEHAMFNEGGEEARALWQTKPALRTREYFAAIDALHRDGRVGRNGMPGPLALATLLTEYRDVFRLAVGPEPLVGGVLAALAPLGRLKGY